MALADAKPMERNEVGIQTAIGILKQRFSERLQTGKDIREQHGHTITYIPNQPPDAVIFVKTTHEVQEIVKICLEYEVPIIPFGVGTSLEGGLNAPAGGISIDLSQMNKVLEVNPEDLDCTVEAGVTREDLNTYLRDSGLFFPIDPGANATLGGMAATRASGTNAVRYGTMRENVISLTAVMPNGEIVKTASRAKKSAAGYDLTRLLVGSEGTLGIITEITLRLHGIPEQISSAVVTFPSVEAACNTTILAIQSGIPIARIELLDALYMKAVNDYSNLNYTQAPTLFTEFHGSKQYVSEQIASFSDIAQEFGGADFQWAEKQEDRNRLWKARHNAFYAGLNLRPGAKGIATDVCVPISKLADCVIETQQDIEENNLIAPILGHVGDGNFHAAVLIDMENPKEIEQVEAFIDRLHKRAIKMNGTCTGEHGIGQGKKNYLKLEHGAGCDIMRMIKQAIDPKNIFNPGKVIPDF